MTYLEIIDQAVPSIITMEIRVEERCRGAIISAIVNYEAHLPDRLISPRRVPRSRSYTDA